MNEDIKKFKETIRKMSIEYLILLYVGIVDAKPIVKKELFKRLDYSIKYNVIKSTR